MAHLFWLFWLSEHQLERIQPFFPQARGVSRVDDYKVLSGSIHVLRSGLIGWMPPMSKRMARRSASIRGCCTPINRADPVGQ